MHTPIRRLLVANRGEIACRIARTARRLGIASLAVYSDADRGARHVRKCDEAYFLGGSAAADSYLNIARLLEVARAANADAVHPGYGFLSENAAFAAACVDAGLAFVGPPPAAILAMGSKSAAKTAMARIGVPVAPGYHGDDQSLDRLCAEAARMGFPLIVKASGGGGGKGMQVVESAGALPRAIEAAQRLARTAFGDERLLLERYFPRARHVEVQVLADGAGRVLPLFDRDCSVQRRHQKVIEEAPAPLLDAAVRTAMAAAAVAAAREVAYVSAGTVEFLVDQAQQFYFMEMNTRLQVEHAVTEMITGIDLVEWQLRIAAGERLPDALLDTPSHGAAIEARLYAEDPARDFLPSVGKIHHLRWPAADANLRVDAGVDAGDGVASDYDPMLGKIIAWGESRAEACDRLHRAIADIEISGVTTNRALLASVLADPEFRGGVHGIDTDYLQRRRTHLAWAEPEAADLDYAAAALWCASTVAERGVLWAERGGWRLGSPARSRWRLGDRTVLIERGAANRYRVRVGEQERELELIGRDAQSISFEFDGQVHRLQVAEQGAQLQLFRRDACIALRRASTEDALEVPAPAVQGSLMTPLPGTVVAVHVRVGDTVQRGAALVTVEAMKMEHTLTAPHSGVVRRIPAVVAQRVAAGEILVELSGA